MFRRSSDRLPVIIILSITLLDFAVYFSVDNVWGLLAYFLLMVLPKGCICAWSHHHQHLPVFRHRWLNRMLEVSFALHTGTTTNLWLLHHVLGHHHNYLDQARDESRWQRADGSTMGELEYTLKTALTAHYRAYIVGKRYAQHYRVHVIYTGVVLALLAALTFYKPLPATLLFILPMTVGLLITAWATYDHHTGLDTDDDFHASYNNLNPLFNWLTGNLGYHTAHHYKQGVHWSELPALHETIKDQIPAELYRTSLWDLVTDGALSRLMAGLFGYRVPFR